MKKFAAMYVGVWVVLMGIVSWWAKVHTADGYRTPLWSGEFWQGMGMLVLFLLLLSQITRLGREVKVLLPRSPWQRIRALRSRCRDLQQQLEDTQAELADTREQLDTELRRHGLLVATGDREPEPEEQSSAPVTTGALTPAAAQ